MIHAGTFTTMMLALLDGMIQLDSDCLIGDRGSNVTTVSADGDHCPEAINYTAQYCQCNYATMDKTHSIIEAARTSSISYANAEDLHDMEQAVRLVKNVLTVPAEILANIRNCTSGPRPCMLLYEGRKSREKKYTDTHHQLQAHLETARTKRNIVLYYMPPLIIVVFICGMIGNCTLLFIFYKHPETRSGPKILLINLAVSDILLLLFNFFGKYYFRLFPFKLGDTACLIYTFISITPAPVSILSIMMLSITRYIAVSAMPGDRSHKLLDHMPGIVALVWVVATLESLQPTLESAITRYEFSDKTHCDIPSSTLSAILMISINCFLPFAIMGFFTLATYRRLRGSMQTKSANTELEKAKERNVKILPALTAFFTITYPPLFIFWLIATIQKFAHYNTLVWFYYLTQFLLNINSALNPIVLYLSSGMFRDYFDKYLHLRCKKGQEEKQQDPEGSSGQTGGTPI